METTTIRISKVKLEKLNNYCNDHGLRQRMVLDILVNSIDKCDALKRLSSITSGEYVSEQSPDPVITHTATPAKIILPSPHTTDDAEVDAFLSNLTSDPFESMKVPNDGDIDSILGGADEL